MADAGALDPNYWTLGVFRDGSGRRRSVDLLSTLYVGLSAMDARLVRKLDKSGLTVDPERVALLRVLVDTINSWKLSPFTIGEYAATLKRFVRWADEQSCSLSRTTIVPLLASYSGESTYRVDAIRRAAVQGLDLPDDERKVFFRAAVPTESPNDDWIVTLETRIGRRTADFLRLVVPGNAALPISDFERIRKTLQMSALDDRSGRAGLIRALRDEFKASATALSHAPSTLSHSFLVLRSLVVWADNQQLALNKNAAIETLVSYSQHLTRQWRAGTLSAHTVFMKATPPLRLLAEVLGRQPFEIRLRMSLPPLTRAGLTSARAETARLQQFCVNLHAIVVALRSDLLCASIEAPKQVKLWFGSEAVPHDLPEPIGGYGDPAFDPRLANLPLIRLRIWAEMHRFIAVTGCNLSVAQNLTIGEWKTDGSRMEAIKDRANKYVSVRASRLYERHIQAHIAFLETTLPARIENDTPLFPGIRFSPARGPSALVAGLRARTVTPIASLLVPAQEEGVRRWAKANGLTLTSRQLRRAKATWLLRRYSGDVLPVARALSNTPQVVHEHYGGKGNLEQAIGDWSRHWALPESQAALAPGKCDSPGRYERLNVQEQLPESCSEGACLICRHYRGENNLDYIHSMLSYRSYLHIRVASNSAVSRLIDIIDQIVDAYLEKNADQREVVHQLQLRIIDQPHRRFAVMIRFAEIMHAS